jgi:hypothetical protein
MGIFTSQGKSLQELPKPSSFDISAIRGSDIGSEISSVKDDMSFSVSEPKVSKKVFVKMDHYKEAIDTIEKIRDKMKDTERLIGDLQRMKSQEDDLLAKWHSDLESIKTKLNKMDEILYDIENE